MNEERKWLTVEQPEMRNAKAAQSGQVRQSEKRQYTAFLLFTSSKIMQKQ